jgi:CheY-like chemotaxis protein
VLVRVGGSQRLDKLRVLLAEDDPDARELTRTMLEWHGARVIAAGTGREALRLFAANRPDVAVVDLKMPELDGFRLIRALRTDPRGAHLPVIALTVLGSDADMMRTLEAGFTAHLAKPVDDVVLASTVRRVVPQR